MDRMLNWLVRWPWIIGVAVFCALTQVALGPWYISAMFIVGAALVATSLARRLKWKLIETAALRRYESLPSPVLVPVEAASRL
jgi:hypothetical protein